MKLSWLSNAPWVPSGYGCQTALFARRLAALGHEVSILAYTGLVGSVINWNRIPVYPAGYSTYSEDVIRPHVRQTRADVLLSLMDIWMLDPAEWTGVRWAPWTPVDTEPIAPPVLGRLRHAAHPIVFSRYALGQFEQNGIQAAYVPHGFDPKVYGPMDQRQAREDLRWPQDRYIVGIVADNKQGADRKSWPEQLEAFSRLRQKHPDAMLYTHTTMGVGRQGYNLVQLCEIFGLRLGEDVIFPDPYLYQLGLPGGYMQRMYASLDCLLSVSYGEGFGIPILEAQACGTPVIVGDWTAMSELCFGGIKIPKDEAEPVLRGTHAFMFKPRVGSVADALKRMYRQSGSELTRRQARQGAAQYDADLIAERDWKPLLERIEQAVNEVPPAIEVAGAL